MKDSSAAKKSLVVKICKAGKIKCRCEDVKVCEASEARGKLSSWGAVEIMSR